MSMIEGVTDMVSHQSVQPTVRKNIFAKVVEGSILGIHIPLPSFERAVYLPYQIIRFYMRQVHHHRKRLKQGKVTLGQTVYPLPPTVPVAPNALHPVAERPIDTIVCLINRFQSLQRRTVHSVTARHILYQETGGIQFQAAVLIMHQHLFQLLAVVPGQLQSLLHHSMLARDHTKYKKQTDYFLHIPVILSFSLPCPNVSFR